MKRLVGLISMLVLAWGVGSAAIGATYSSTPVADAFVATGASGNLVSNNYGGGGALAVAAPGLPNGEFQSVIKFDLSAARAALDAQFGQGGWSVQSVLLQLSSSPHNNAIYNNVAAGQFGVSLMANGSWIEGTGNASSPANNGISFSSLQGVYLSAADQALGTFAFDGGTSGENSYSLALSPGLNADVLAGGAVSLRLFAADSAVSYLFSSRAALPVASEPQLVIEAVPEPRGLAWFGLVLAGGYWFRRRRRAAPPADVLALRPAFVRSGGGKSPGDETLHANMGGGFGVRLLPYRRRARAGGPS